MNKTLFSSSFYFTEYHFTKYRSTNNTHGISTHFIGYMRKGHARFVSEEGETEVNEGELFYIPLGCRYRSYWYGEPDICFDSYSFTHYPEEGEEGFCLQAVPMTEGAREALEALASDKRVSCRSVARLYLLFGEMLPFLRPQAQSAKERTLRKALTYIEAHPRLLVKDVARHAGISESGLYALFKECLGKTPIAYKNEKLARRAVLLLTTTDKSVEEIRQGLGFESAAHFRKIIQSATGKTPSAIRRERRDEM